MAGVLLSAAVAVSAAVLAVAGKVVGTQPTTIPVSPFGGSVAVHLTRVGHIDTDLEASGSGLTRVRCAGAASAGTACFVSR